MPNEWRVFVWQCVVIGVVFAGIAFLNGCLDAAALWPVCYVSPLGEWRPLVWQQFCDEANFAP